MVTFVSDTGNWKLFRKREARIGWSEYHRKARRPTTLSSSPRPAGRQSDHSAFCLTYIDVHTYRLRSHIQAQKAHAYTKIQTYMPSKDDMHGIEANPIL